MARALRRIKMLADQARNGGKDEAVADIRRWMWSDEEAVGFRRDFDLPIDVPSAGVPLEVVDLDASMAKKVFRTDDLGPADRLYLERRRGFYDAGFEGARVVVDHHGEPAYLQWFVPARQNQLIRSFFGPLFPELTHDTLLVEGAWIPPVFRGKRVMSEALALAGEAVRASSPPEVRYAVAYVAVGNRGALFGTRDAGYEVVERRTEQWRLGRRSVKFAPAVEGYFDVFERRATR